MIQYIEMPFALYDRVMLDAHPLYANWALVNNNI